VYSNPVRQRLIGAGIQARGAVSVDESGDSGMLHPPIADCQPAAV